MISDSAYNSEVTPQFAGIKSEPPKADELAQRFLDSLEHNKNIAMKSNIRNYIK
jgi:hypothetical protein